MVGAISSGLLLRAAGSVLNLLAVPIAIHTLGQQRYAAFAALLGLAAWIGIGNSGLGTATTVAIGETSDEKERRALFWRGAISTVVMVSVVAAILFIPFLRLTRHLIPNASPVVEHELTRAAYYCFAAFTIVGIGSTFSGFYVGTMRAKYVNWCQFSGQCVGIVLLLTLPRLLPDMITICIAVTFGTVMVAAWSIVKGTLDCPPPFPFHYRIRESLPLFREGVGFLASSLSTLFYSGASLSIIAITFGTAELATAGVMSRLIQMYLSVLAILLIPLTPALRNALATDERAWVRMALKRTGLLLGGAGIGGAGVLVFFGNAIVTRWTGTVLPALPQWLWATAVFLLVVSWSYFWIYACFAIRGSLLVAVVAAVEVAVVIVQFFIFGHRVAPSFAMLIMAGSMLALSGAVLPVIVIHDLRRLRLASFRQLRERPVYSPAAGPQRPAPTTYRQ